MWRLAAAPTENFGIKGTICVTADSNLDGLNMTSHNPAYLIVLIMLVASGCASTKVASYRDPEFATANYSRILVIVPFSDFESKQTAEAAFADKCESVGLSCKMGGQVLPPTRTYSPDQIKNIVQENDIDAVLLVTLTDAWTDESYIPPSSTSTTKGQLNSIGNSVYYSSTTSKMTSGGYYITKPRVTSRSQLFDVKTGKVAWAATSLTRGNAYAKLGRLMSSLASSTIDKLISDGLVRKQ
jgi:hypothetical protein